MLLLNMFQYLAILLLVYNVSCRSYTSTPDNQKQLFVSRRVVTDVEEFDGGVLVDEYGKIEGILSRSEVDQITENLDDNLIKIIDGGELVLMPGMIDSHVHLNEPGRTSWEGFSTGTQAAAAGGITTVVDMPLNSIPPTTSLENLKIKAKVAKEEVYVDVGFWGGVIPDNAGKKETLVEMIAAGVVGFKGYLIDSGVDEFPNLTPEEMVEAFEVLDGTGTVLAFHAELNITDEWSSTSTNETLDPTLYSTYLASRPDRLEIDAATLIAKFIPKVNLHVHVVHVSSAAVVPLLEAARAERLQAGHRGWRGGVTAETCPHYLLLHSETIPRSHTEYKCSPPIRNNTNREKLWSYIDNERLDLIVSDHSPSTENLKGADFMEAWGGVSSVQFGLSLFWTEASTRGFSLSAACHYLSTGPARLTGLDDKKGGIRPGLDADLIFFDPNAEFIVTPEVILYKNKISPYMGRKLRGKVIATYVRGQLVYENGKIIGEPKGQLLLNSENIWE